MLCDRVQMRIRLFTGAEKFCQTLPRPVVEQPQYLEDRFLLRGERLELVFTDVALVGIVVIPGIPESLVEFLDGLPVTMGIRINISLSWVESPPVPSRVEGCVICS